MSSTLLTLSDMHFVYVVLQIPVCFCAKIFKAAEEVKLKFPSYFQRYMGNFESSFVIIWVWL